MLDLNQIYNNLPLPNSPSLNSFSAKAITGYENHRIAKNIYNNPSLLILISEKDQDFLVANQNLFSIQVSHNIRCEIQSENGVTYNNFSVISYTGQNIDIKNLFLNTCQVLMKSLGQNPTNKQIKYTVDKFVELFKAVKATPRNSVQGLWCELFLIKQSSFPEKMIASWHSIPEEKFDFSFGKLRLEVKSSSSESRLHHFSSEQLNPIDDVKIIIASILVNSDSGGYSISDLLIEINKKLDNYPKQKEKLHLLTYSTLGNDIEKVNQVKFDFEFAKNSLKFFRSSSIPKIDSISIPKEVTNLKFISNLINSKNVQINMDKLLNDNF